MAIDELVQQVRQLCKQVGVKDYLFVAHGRKQRCNTFALEGNKTKLGKALVEALEGIVMLEPEFAFKIALNLTALAMLGWTCSVCVEEKASKVKELVSKKAPYSAGSASVYKGI